MPTVAAAARIACIFRRSPEPRAIQSPSSATLTRRVMLIGCVALTLGFSARRSGQAPAAAAGPRDDRLPIGCGRPGSRAAR